MIDNMLVEGYFQGMNSLVGMLIYLGFRGYALYKLCYTLFIDRDLIRLFKDDFKHSLLIAKESVEIVWQNNPDMFISDPDLYAHLENTALRYLLTFFTTELSLYEVTLYAHNRSI